MWEKKKSRLDSLIDSTVAPLGSYSQTIVHKVNVVLSHCAIIILY